MITPGRYIRIGHCLARRVGLRIRAIVILGLQLLPRHMTLATAGIFAHLPYPGVGAYFAGCPIRGRPQQVLVATTADSATCPSETVPHVEAVVERLWSGAHPISKHKQFWHPHPFPLGQTPWSHNFQQAPLGIPCGLGSNDDDQVIPSLPPPPHLFGWRIRT